jgi:hypothetical protein
MGNGGQEKEIMIQKHQKIGMKYYKRNGEIKNEFTRMGKK